MKPVVNCKPQKFELPANEKHSENGSNVRQVVSESTVAIGIQNGQSKSSPNRPPPASLRNANLRNFLPLDETAKKTVESAVENIRTIHATMKPRLEAYKKQLEVDPNRSEADIPSGLAPCDEVNGCLDSLVTICNQNYSANEAKAIQCRLNDIALDLRDISNLSEGEMERVSLDYIFAVHKNMKMPALDGYLNTKDNRINHLRKIVFDIPNNAELEGISESLRFPFPYAENYNKMAENELRLLTKDNSIPNLKNKTISFIGAGFPLSAIMYNIYSGAKINLVDIDKGACERAEDFLDICAETKIINRDDFSVTQGDASKIRYVKKSTADVVVQASEKMTAASQPESAVLELQSDILVFAAALSGEVKAAALKNVSSRGLDIINRCTSETNNLLYPSTKLSALRKFHNLESSSRVFVSEKVMYPKHSFINKTTLNQAGISVNKRGIPAIETDEINQNTAQKISIVVSVKSIGTDTDSLEKN